MTILAIDAIRRSWYWLALAKNRRTSLSPALSSEGTPLTVLGRKDSNLDLARSKSKGRRNPFVKMHKPFGTLEIREPYRTRRVQSSGEKEAIRRRTNQCCRLEVRSPIQKSLLLLGSIAPNGRREYTVSAKLAEGEELGSNLLRAVHSSCRYPGGPDLDREIGEPPGGASRPSRAVPLGFEITPTSQIAEHSALIVPVYFGAMLLLLHVAA